ncbi:hypothetical protein EDC01DRAFT_497209 [Geopyxis carbonaria]|nr:hypothetical protein EDC01DRAFT_497209 [Geopyxis carbonaria]
MAFASSGSATKHHVFDAARLAHPSCSICMQCIFSLGALKLACSVTSPPLRRRSAGAAQLIALGMDDEGLESQQPASLGKVNRNMGAIPARKPSCSRSSHSTTPTPPSSGYHHHHTHSPPPILPNNVFPALCVTFSCSVNQFGSQMKAPQTSCSTVGCLALHGPKIDPNHSAPPPLQPVVQRPISIHPSTHPATAVITYSARTAASRRRRLSVSYPYQTSGGSQVAIIIHCIHWHCARRERKNNLHAKSAEIEIKINYGRRLRHAGRALASSSSSLFLCFVLRAGARAPACEPAVV